MAKMIRNVAAGCCVALLLTLPAFAQTTGSSTVSSAPPVHGVVVPQDTMKKFYRAASITLVAAKAGVQNAYRFAKEAIVDGSPIPGSVTETRLEGLREGAVVVVQSVSDEDRMETEGRVAHIDKRRNQITIKYDDGTFDILQLIERTIEATWPDEEQAIAAHAAGAQAAVYYNDEDGQRVVRFFRWVR